MPNVTYFVQDCPTCGRKLNIRVAYLGRKVVCQHCHGGFVAWDPEGAPQNDETVVQNKAAGSTGSMSKVGGGSSTGSSSTSLSGSKLLDRAQELLELAEQKIAESRIIRAKLDAETADIVQK